ncbi:MAG: cysteine peptidase family C39 domain-containing protein, partial [Longimicrobiales bacterium]
MNHRCRVGAALLAAALALPWCVHAQATVERGSARAAAELLLDVPFVPQSEALCGGAALAMVLRFHGDTRVYAEDFATLVVAGGAGIRTTDLTTAARAHGMHVTPFVAERDVVRALLAERRPVIALIENRRGVYHYIVLLAWADGRVLFHDPAIGPHQV